MIASALQYRHAMPFGSTVREDGGVRFALYAPGTQRVDLLVESGGGHVRTAMTHTGDGWFEAVVVDASPGTRYRFAAGDLVFPDPASRFQPEGVHGPSEVVDPGAFRWTDEWAGRPWNEHVFYELHVGTFTPEGTYAAAQSKLDYLYELGITAIEIMPIAEAPGTRNWGYDGVLPFAPSHNYGRPEDLKAFVAAAHERNIAVYLDVVYNHFGPEANYLSAYAKPFYTDKIQTPWGAAIDVVDDDRADVRRFFIENTLYWLEEYRFDGLRFDAVHAIYDGPTRRFLRELADTAHARVSRPVNLIVENERNEASLLDGGRYRAQWADDLHNALHVAVTSQTEGYYGDFSDDTIGKLARALCEGFAYQGEATKLKGEPRGERSAHLELSSFVTFLQNHDQVGNRPFGDRITDDTAHAAVHAAAAIVLLAPQIPMLFMGEEWGASTPFLFFCDFEPELAAKVTEGRRAEFASFAAFADPDAREKIPDPSAEATFERSKLRWDERSEDGHARWLERYRALIRTRLEDVVPKTSGLRGTDAAFERIGEYGLIVRYRLASGETLALQANLGAGPIAGFPKLDDARTLYETRPDAFAGERVAGWNVRWSIA